MTEYSRMAHGTFTSTGAAKVINLPFQPTQVEMWNYSAAATPAQHGVPYAFWDSNMGQGFAYEQVYATPALSGGITFSLQVLNTDVVTSNGIKTFAAGLSLQYGALVALGASGAIAKTDSSTLSVTTTAAHGLAVGDWIVFQNLYQTSTTGMQQISGIPFIVKSVGSTTTFTVAWAGTASNLTALTNAHTGGGTAGFKKILYPELYLPGVAFPWSITLSSGVVTVYTTAPTNFKVGQEIAFNIPSIYGGNELNELVGNNVLTIPASPNYYYVTEVGSVAVNSTYVDYFKFNFSGTLSAFSVANPTFASFPGLGFAQVKAVGDVNTGGATYSGGNLYPSPNVVVGNSTTTLLTTPTINGPAIQGAFINNTSQGFIIGTGAGTNDASSVLVGANGNVIYWRAFFQELNLTS